MYLNAWRGSRRRIYAMQPFQKHSLKNFTEQYFFRALVHILQNLNSIEQFERIYTHNLHSDGRSIQ